MLTVEECRKLIDGHEEYSDEQIRKIRDDCHALAQLAMESYFDKVRSMEKKELIIAVIEKDNTILMRKKPADSSPYKETWYSFGCERIPSQDDSTTLKNYLKSEIGIEVDVSSEQIPSNTEIKVDHDGKEKNFIYLNLRCNYLGGDPKTPQGAERVEWIQKDKLTEFDIVPPSIKLFRTLGYIK